MFINSSFQSFIVNSLLTERSIFKLSYKIKYASFWYYFIAFSYPLRALIAIFCFQSNSCDVSIGGEFISMAILKLANKSTTLASAEVLLALMYVFADYIYHESVFEVIDEMHDYYHALGALSHMGFKDVLRYDYSELHFNKIRFVDKKFKNILWLTIVFLNFFSKICYFCACKLELCFFYSLLKKSLFYRDFVFHVL